jgi:hypothetical protein
VLGGRRQQVLQARGQQGFVAVIRHVTLAEVPQGPAIAAGLPRRAGEGTTRFDRPRQTETVRREGRREGLAVARHCQYLVASEAGGIGT